MTIGNKMLIVGIVLSILFSCALSAPFYFLGRDKTQHITQDITYWVNGRALTINNLRDYTQGDTMSFVIDEQPQDHCAIRVDLADNWIIVYQWCDNATNDHLWTYDSLGNWIDF